MPQLPFGRVDGYHAAVAARRRHAPASAFHGSKDLYRLPQGHCSQAARHAWRAWLAVRTKAFRVAPPLGSTLLAPYQELESRSAQCRPDCHEGLVESARRPDLAGSYSGERVPRYTGTQANKARLLCSLSQLQGASWSSRIQVNGAAT